MFKIFKKTAAKAEKAIDKASADMDDVISETKDVVSSVKPLIYLGVIGLTLGITADLISIAVGIKTLRKLK